MKHVKKVKNFGSSKGQRNAALKNLAKDLIKNEFLRTTKAKARAVRAFVDAFISKAKSKSVNVKLLEGRLGDAKLVEKVMNDLVVRYKDTNGGYIQEFKLGYRAGDGAEYVKLMLNGYEPKIVSKLKKVKSATSEKKESKKEVVAASKVKKESAPVKDQVTSVTKQRAKSRSGL